MNIMHSKFTHYTDTELLSVLNYQANSPTLILEDARVLIDEAGGRIDTLIEQIKYLHLEIERIQD